MELLVDLASLGTSSASQPSFRAAALARLGRALRFEAAIFHALSPRVPLETGAFVGIDADALRASATHWDQSAVTLGRLRELANARMVATDRMAFPLGSPSRAHFERELGKPFRARAAVVVHLVVRDAVRAVVLLVRRKDPAFDEAEVTLLERVAPVLALADATQAALDAAASVAVPVRLVCTDQRLTDRQREIVAHVALGHTNDDIAAALGLSPHTLRNHLARVFVKLGASNRADVVRLAVLSRAP